MTKRQIVKLALQHKPVPYVPWHCTFTVEAADKLKSHFATDDLETALDNHFVKLGSDIGFFDALPDNRFRDIFGVIWDRSVDKDIGIVENCMLPEPTMSGYDLPDPLDNRFFAAIPEKLRRHGDRFRIFKIGFSLYERAWTLRGMENLMMDFILHPAFSRELLAAIADYNIAQVRKALEYDIDAVYFGDDWGCQRGLQMGPALWHEFIGPQLQRMYSVVRDAGKFVMIHSCGKVDELFDPLIRIGLHCFNPFQPEVMDVFNLLSRYRGRLAFHGGLSTQKTLPYGSPSQVQAQSRALIEAGARGGYIFAPAHAVEGDVPLKNIITFIQTLHCQPGYKRKKP